MREQQSDLGRSSFAMGYSMAGPLAPDEDGQTGRADRADSKEPVYGTAAASESNGGSHT